MSFRRIIFWSHLATGCVAGLFVLLMSVTGIVLMFEHHLPLNIVDSVKIEPVDGSPRLTIDELAQTEAVQAAGQNGVSLAFDNRNDAPVILRAGRSDQVLLNPYTGESLGNPAQESEDFFHMIMGVHRWLGAEGDARSTARAVTGAANLAFLFLVISGLYLWFPKAMKWVFFKLNLFFRPSYPNSKARDYNWHHVFGFWALIPLFFIVVSGVMISYPWATQLIYTAWGEEMPQRRGPPTPGGEAEVSTPVSETLTDLQSAVDAAIAEYAGDWKRISITLPSDPTASTVSLTRDFGNRITPQQRTNITFDRTTGEITNTRGYSENSPAMKTRMFLRFIHTGERYGFIGSTIAGLASLAACFLVWTGIALSWRRLVLPAWRRRKTKKA